MKFFKLIRENLKDPKKKSLTLLGVYAIFFISVFAILKASETPSSSIDLLEVKEKKNYTNYEYVFTIYDNEDTYKIIGSYVDDVNEIRYNDYKEETTDIDYNYKLLKKIVENSDSETRYKDSNIVNYNITANKYFELMNKNDYCIDKDCSMMISINMDENKSINNTSIDLTNYYGYNYKIELEYNFLDEVK